MGQRTELQTLLKSIVGLEDVYFQAPPDNMMKYPCIVYELAGRETTHADNNPYRTTKRYQVTVIDRNVDSKIPDAVAALPLCSFARKFTANNLHHEVFNLYF